MRMRKGSTHSKVIMFRMVQRITIILQGKCTSCLIFNSLGHSKEKHIIVVVSPLISLMSYERSSRLTSATWCISHSFIEYIQWRSWCSWRGIIFCCLRHTRIMAIKLAMAFNVVLFPNRLTRSFFTASTPKGKHFEFSSMTFWGVTSIYHINKMLRSGIGLANKSFIGKVSIEAFDWFPSYQCGF